MGSPLEGGGSKLDTREEASIEKAELVVIEEDRRRSEDSVVVINRQEEVEEEQQVGVAGSGCGLKVRGRGLEVGGCGLEVLDVMGMLVWFSGPMSLV